MIFDVVVGNMTICLVTDHYITSLSTVYYRRCKECSSGYFNISKLIAILNFNEEIYANAIPHLKDTEAKGIISVFLRKHDINCNHTMYIYEPGEKCHMCEKQVTELHEVFCSLENHKNPILIKNGKVYKKRLICTNCHEMVQSIEMEQAT